MAPIVADGGGGVAWPGRPRPVERATGPPGRGAPVWLGVAALTSRRVTRMRRLVEVAPQVFVATASQYTTTSTVLVVDDRAVVIDPAWTPAELDALAADVADLGLTVTAGFATHAHRDHVLWHPGLSSPRRWASPRTVSFAAETRDEMVAALGGDLTPELEPLFACLTALEGDVLVEPFGDRYPDEQLRAVVHDGHAPGHTALLWESRRVLVAGDMLSDIELPLPFEPDDLAAYLVSLDRLAPLVAAADLLVPGHGRATTRPLERLDADRTYLDRVLAGRAVDDPRIVNPGMADAHRRVLELARALR